LLIRFKNWVKNIYRLSRQKKLRYGNEFLDGVMQLARQITHDVPLANYITLLDTKRDY